MAEQQWKDRMVFIVIVVVAVSKFVTSTCYLSTASLPHAVSPSFTFPTSQTRKVNWDPMELLCAHKLACIFLHPTCNLPCTLREKVNWWKSHLNLILNKLVLEDLKNCLHFVLGFWIIFFFIPQPKGLGDIVISLASICLSLDTFLWAPSCFFFLP